MQMTFLQKETKNKLIEKKTHNNEKKKTTERKVPLSCKLKFQQKANICDLSDMFIGESG